MKEKIIQFYLKDGINSRQLPGRKDWKSVKQPNGRRKKIQKRLLLKRLKELFVKYSEEAKDDEKVGFSTFKSLRPKYCVFPTDAAAMNICVCMIHENTNFMVEALKATTQFGNKEISQMIKDFTNNLVCTNPTNSCYLRECSKCNELRISDFVQDKLDDIEEMKFNIWVTSPRAEKKEHTEHIDDFLDRLNGQFEKFLVHQFKVNQQYSFIQKKKEALIPGKELLIQMDFAERYTCKSQNSIQSTYFDSKSVSIHPFVVYSKSATNGELKYESYIVISDAKAQNTNSVYTFQKKLIPILLEQYPNLKKIHYLSDGCAEQYKNKKSFKNLCHHKKDFGIDAEWHFFPTSHGKGPCDGFGGQIKRMAYEATVMGGTITDAETFFIWAESIKPKLSEVWNFIKVTEEECQTTEVELQDRFIDLIPLEGTQHYHSFKPKDENHIYAFEFSGQFQDEDENENKNCFRLVKKKALKLEPLPKPETSTEKHQMQLRCKKRPRFDYDETNSLSNSDDE